MVASPSNIDIWVSRGARLFSQNPERFIPIVNAVIERPDIVFYLPDYETGRCFEQVMIELGHQPDILYQNLTDVLEQIEMNVFPIADPPELAGFSGQPKCLITFIIVFPVLILIATMIETFTIIMCLNIGGCFESIMQNMFKGFSQGLQNGF